MAEVFEIRDPEQAQAFLYESFLGARLAEWTPLQFQKTMQCCAEILSEGNPIPVAGFVADILAMAAGATSVDSESLDHGFSGFGNALCAQYEDQVIGKLFADMSFERGIDALPRYEGRDQLRAASFLIHQITTRCKLNGFLLSPAVAKGLGSEKHETIQETLAPLRAGHRDPSVIRELQELVGNVRNTGQLLGAEDIFELESGTALSKFGQRIALRQVLQAEEYLRQGLPKDKPRGMSRDYAVATNILEEDTYPIGGFTSITNRGTMESLLRSELAYIEDDQRPDIFDIKYVRDELLYYSRDENQFFRRRVCFQFVLDATLTQTRVKDVGSNWQRIISLLAMIVTSVRCLSDWLSSDALRFEILFVKQRGKRILHDEFLLLETILQDEVGGELLSLSDISLEELRERGEASARRSLCHCTIFSTSESLAPRALEPEDEEAETRQVMPLLTLVHCDDAHPTVIVDETSKSFDEELDPWRAAMREMLLAWL